MEPVVTPSLNQDRAPTCTPLDSVRKEELADAQGNLYKEFRQQLRPKFAKVWMDLLLGHAILAITALATVQMERVWPQGWILEALVCAVLVGTFSAYIQLFFHEAAHYNIAPKREWNDWLANVFIGSLVGQDIRDYRIIHFDHHRYLGTDRDTERSYFDPLNARFFWESILGLKAWRVLSGRRQALRAGQSQTRAKPPGSWIPLMIGALVHGSVVGIGVWLQSWALVLGWLVGTGIGLPLLGALRQLLEHRAVGPMELGQRPGPRIPAVTRMFGAGLFPGMLGGAGFNRHLLHHWEPQVSYTRLAELERFLLDTPAGPVVSAMRTSYSKALVELAER